MQTQDNQVVGQAQRIISNIRRVVVGKDQVLLWVLAAIGGGIITMLVKMFFGM